jgi:hypothetical protein
MAPFGTGIQQIQLVRPDAQYKARLFRVMHKPALTSQLVCALKLLPASVCLRGIY